MTIPETQAALRAAPPRVVVPLCDLGLAPENLRAAEPEDADVARLAETIRAAGLIYPPIVRRGRRGEAAFMVLDGRRRRFALLRLAAEGALPDDHPVECLLAEDRREQAAAAVLPNAEHAPVHPTDVIVAIGKLRRSRMTTPAIAEALGYDEIEVKRLEAMAHVHEDVLAAFRAGKLTQRQVRMFARLKDKTRQGELALEALADRFYDQALQSLVSGGRVTVADPRFSLVPEAAYAAAGGRLMADLFGELPAEALDPEILDDCWRTAAARLAQPLADEGLRLILARERGFAAPDGLEHLPFVHWASLADERRAVFEAAQTRIEAAAESLVGADETDRDSCMDELVRARLDLARLRAGRGEVAAVLLTPMRGGVDLTFFSCPPASEAEMNVGPDQAEGDDDGSGCDREDPHECPSRWRDIEPTDLEVDVSGVSNAQHAAATDIATRGLIRDLADCPEAAVVVLTAHLFAELALQDVRGPDEAALRIRATGGPRGDGPEDGLAGDVWARLAQWREVYRAAGERPLGFVKALEPDARQRLLGELVAVSLDLREPRTDRLRCAARTEAVEIAALCGADLSQRWVPDRAFLALHSRVQLADFLEEMGVGLPKPSALKKDELVQAVAEAAAARRWLPACLRWPQAAADRTAGVEPRADGDAAIEPAPDTQAA